MIRKPHIEPTFPVVIVLPYGLSQNAAWITLPSKAGEVPRRAKSKKYTDWQKLVTPMMKRALGAHGILKPLEGDMVLTITARRPRINSDVTNLNKTIEDTLKIAGAYGDDKQVTDARQVWARDLEGRILTGRKVTIRLTPYLNPQELNLRRR